MRKRWLALGILLFFLTLAVLPAPETQHSDEYWEAKIGKYLSEKIDLNNVNVVEHKGVKKLVICYTTRAKTDEDFGAEMGVILGAFVAAKKSGWDADVLDCTVYSPYTNKYARWYCKKEWVEQRLDGKITDEELALIVLTTLSSY